MSIIARARHRLGRAWILSHYYRYYLELHRRIRTILALDESALDLADDGGEEERALPGFGAHRRTGYYRVMLARYLCAVPHIRGKRVLEVGGGLGWGSHLIGDYAATYRCVDRDDDAVAFARRTWPDSGIVHERRSVEELSELVGPFDVILAFELIEHLEVPSGRLFLEQVGRLLPPGGVLMLSSFFPDDEGVARQCEQQNRHHPHIYTKAEMGALLAGAGLGAPRFVASLLLEASRASRGRGRR